MRKLLFIALLFTAWVNAQQLDPPRTGKDSVSIETSLVVMTEKFTTAEIYAFTRVGGEKPAYVFNSDTETIWAWTGTEWKDLGLAPASGGITIDPTIQNGSTNPVENNAVYDRLLSVVDHDPLSPIQDVTIFKGTKAEFEAAKASLGADYLAIVTDSIYDPSPSGSGVDGYISNVVVSGNNMTFTGQGGGFNGTVSLPSSGGSGTPQTLSQSFSNSTRDLTTTISDGNTQVTALDALWQDADDVTYDDGNSYLNANDVQEALDDLLDEGIDNATPTLLGNIGAGSFTNIGQATVEWSRVGNIVFFNGYFTADFVGGDNTNEIIAGGAFWLDLPGLPDFRNTIGQLQRDKIHFGLTTSLSQESYERVSYVTTNANQTRLYLDWGIKTYPNAVVTLTGSTWSFSGVYLTGNVNN